MKLVELELKLESEALRETENLEWVAGFFEAGVD